MFDAFDPARLHHLHRAPKGGDAAHRVLTAEAFAAARAEIETWEGHRPTPLHHLGALAAELGLGDVLYKDEGGRFGLGSFKALGGAYASARTLQREIAARLGRAVSLEEIRRGDFRAEAAQITLVTATDGNHGRSVAWGAARFGAAARIYIHAEVSQNRADAMAAYGAQIVRVAGDYDASVAAAREDSEANGWFVVSDTSWEGYRQPPLDVMAGYGLIAHEAGEALGAPPTHVLLQGGVGGLPAAVAAGLRQRWGADAPRVVIVEPELAACLYASAQAGRLTNVKIREETMMAGLSCGEPSPLAWAILDDEASDFITIPEAYVAPTIRLLGRPLGGDAPIVAGESAVAGLAALIAIARDERLRAALGLDAHSRPLVIGSEGATDPDIYAHIMEEGFDA